jgi:hypothetical protein
MIQGIEYRILLKHNVNSNKLQTYIADNYADETMALDYDKDRNMLIIVDYLHAKDRFTKIKDKLNTKLNTNTNFSLQIPHKIKNVCIPIHDKFTITLNMYEQHLLNSILIDPMISRYIIHSGMWYEYYEYSKYSQYEESEEKYTSGIYYYKNPRSDSILYWILFSVLGCNKITDL